MTLGPVIDGKRVVRSGLQAGENVIVNGLQRVRPNDVVAPVVAGVTPPQAGLKTSQLDKPPKKTQI